MGLTNFPNGVASFGIPILPKLEDVTTGEVFFVQSTTGSNGNSGTDKDHPFADLTYALSKCSAGAGDRIYCMPSHAETISASGDLTLNVAGAEIIGIGRGAYRPTITYDTADTAILLITGASTRLRNFILTANYADVAMAVDVDAVDVSIEGCSFLETATSMNFFSCIGTDDTNNAADGLTIIGNERISVDAAALAFISILANISRLTVIGNFDSQSSAANIGHFIIMGAFVCLHTKIIGNTLILNGDNSAQTVGIFATGSSTTSTGVMAYNLEGSLDTTTELFDTATLDFMHFNNYHVGTIATSGKLWPAADA